MIRNLSLHTYSTQQMGDTRTQLHNQTFTNRLNQKISFFEYLVVLILIIYSGNANTFVQTDAITDNPVGFIIPVIVAGIIAVRWKIAFDQSFYTFTLGLGIYFLAISFKFQNFHPTTFITYFLLFFIVYALVRSLKFNIFKIYEIIIFYLAILALIMWGIQTVLGGDTLYDLIGNYIPETFSYVSGSGYNILIYSIQPMETILINNFGSVIPRNCGFAWEPGGFAVYLCLAIFINLFINKGDKNKKTRFIILLIALITTQSTTGYMIFSIILLYYYLNKRFNIILLGLPLIISTFIYVFSLPFMGNKIISLLDETNNINGIVQQSMYRETGTSPQRFSSLLIDLKDFYNNPILGLGGNSEESWTTKIGAKISTISGIGNILAQFGTVGFLFFIILSYKSSLFFSKIFNYKGKLLLFFVVLFISISYSIILFPLVMCFWMFSFVYANKVVYSPKIIFKNS